MWCFEKGLEACILSLEESNLRCFIELWSPNLESWSSSGQVTFFIMTQPLLLPIKTAPVIYFLFLKVRSGRRPYSSKKMHLFNFLFKVTSFIVKKPLTCSNKHCPSKIYFLFISERPVWNQALLFQKRVFPTCINFACFHCEETFTLPQKLCPYNLLFISKKSSPQRKKTFPICINWTFGSNCCLKNNLWFILLQ